MTVTLKVRDFDGSLGFLLPNSITELMALKEGDELFVSVTQEGIQFSLDATKDPDMLEDARNFMRSHQNAFDKLAK